MSGALVMTHAGPEPMRPSKPFSVAGQRVVVVGGARSGLAAAMLLRSRGAHVVLSEARDTLQDIETLTRAGLEVELGGHRPETFAHADLIVTSPGVELRQPAIAAARAAGVPVIGELELASRWLVGPIVAVTGTKGKSTTTTLVGRMLAEAGRRVLVGGNIGAPLSGQVEQSGPDVVHVVEASSFQLETTTTFHPAIAVFLNFSPDHLDRHVSVEAYAAAKARIFANQVAGDHAVVNADDAVAVDLARHGSATVVRFSATSRSDAEVGIEGSWIVGRTPHGEPVPLVPLSEVRLIGRHLLADVVAAVAIARLLGVPGPAMTRAVAEFTGLEHALEPVAVVNGVRFVNDSKATNLDAARQAVESFEAGLVVILGGHFKGGDLSALVTSLERRGASAVLIGESAPLFRGALEGRVRARDAATLEEAVQAAYEWAKPAGVVLLAPACASFDMFHDYAERGRAFKAEVARLAAAARGSRER